MICQLGCVQVSHDASLPCTWPGNPQSRSAATSPLPFWAFRGADLSFCHLSYLLSPYPVPSDSTLDPDTAPTNTHAHTNTRTHTHTHTRDAAGAQPDHVNPMWPPVSALLPPPSR